MCLAGRFRGRTISEPTFSGRTLPTSVMPLCRRSLHCEAHALPGDGFLTVNVYSHRQKEWVGRLAMPYIICYAVAALASLFVIAHKMRLFVVGVKSHWQHGGGGGARRPNAGMAAALTPVSLADIFDSDSLVMVHGIPVPRALAEHADIAEHHKALEATMRRKHKIIGMLVLAMLEGVPRIRRSQPRLFISWSRILNATGSLGVCGMPRVQWLLCHCCQTCRWRRSPRCT